MMTTADQIRGWLQLAMGQDATHVIVVCDDFDHSDYPVIVGPEEDFWELYDSHNGKNMQRVMEVYDLSLDIETQLAEVRAKHYPPRPEEEIMPLFGFLGPSLIELTGKDAERVMEILRRRGKAD